MNREKPIYVQYRVPNSGLVFELKTTRAQLETEIKKLEGMGYSVISQIQAVGK